MTWFAELLLLGAAVTGDSTVPAGLELRVREAVARAWRVPAVQVQVAWGQVAGRAELSDSSAFRLAGRGLAGRWVVVVTTEQGGAVAIGVRAGVEDSVWLAARPLPLGSTVGEGDLTRGTRLRWGPPPADADSPIGWEVRRSLAQGDPVEAPAVLEPAVIRAGDRVRFVWRQGSIAVVREAIAGNTARRGETVWARDPERGDRLVGTALGRGLVDLRGER